MSIDDLVYVIIYDSLVVFLLSSLSSCFYSLWVLNRNE